MSTAPAIPSMLRIRTPRFCRFVSAWVIVSFFGSLVICCELFSAEPAHAAETVQSEIAHTPSHLHGHTHGLVQQHDHSLSSTDGQLCASKYLPKFTTLTILGGNSFDDKPFILTHSDDRKISTPHETQFSETFSEPHMGSPPLYLLFHRLLIAHSLT